MVLVPMYDWLILVGGGLSMIISSDSIYMYLWPEKPIIWPSWRKVAFGFSLAVAFIGIYLLILAAKPEEFLTVASSILLFAIFILVYIKIAKI